MSIDAKADDRVPAEPLYLLAGFGALLVQLLLLALREMSIVGLIASVIGSAGLLFRWRAGPFVLLLFLSFAFLVSPPGGLFRQFADLLQAAALLAYLFAQFRLFGLEEQAVPVTAGRSRPGSGLKGERRLREVRAGEVARGALAVGGTLVAATALWASLPTDPVVLGEQLRVMPGVEVLVGVPPRSYWEAFAFGEGWWQLFLLTWLFAVAFITAWTVLSYFGWQRMPVAEAQLVVQDVAWEETRREQQRLQTWRQKGKRDG